MNSESPLHTRREFLRGTLLGGALSWTVPSFLAETFAALHAEAANSATQVVTGKDSPILVIVQMAGGNDGLNTVIPFSNDDYRRARPRLGVAANSVLKLNDQLGLHEGMEGFKSLYDAGQLAIVQGVGYPNPNRSHFRSTEIWQTASDSERFEKYGWLGRYFDHACQGSDPTVGVNIGRQMPQAFSGPKPVGVSLENPENYRFVSDEHPQPGETGLSEQFYRQLNHADGIEMEGHSENNSGGSISAISGSAKRPGSVLDFLERTALDAQVSSDQIRAISRKVKNEAIYPGSPFGNGLRLIARLIGGGLPTRVYYVSQGGYDTHTNQLGAQDRLLRDLGDSVKAFTDDLKAQGNFQRVVLMTFSEFGRRVAENASGGTDHGAAAPLFVVGPKVKAGLIGELPSLAPEQLVNGDLKYHTDFRCLYAGLLEGWLQTPSAPILGRAFAPLNCV